MNIKKYKYIISLEGERFLCYYDLLSESGEVIETSFDDIDLTPTNIQTNSSIESSAIFEQAIAETDMGINHSKTINYIKQTYIDKLRDLRGLYFNNYIYQINDIYFPINAEYVNYYDHIKQDIENNISSSIFVDIQNKTVKWAGNIILSFESFINYYTQISQFISNKNNEYIQDQQTILQIKEEDFSSEIMFDWNNVSYQYAQKSYNASKNAVYLLIQTAFQQINIAFENNILYRIDIDKLINDAIKTCKDMKNETLENEIRQAVDKMYINYDHLKNIIDQFSRDKKKDITTETLNAILVKWSL